MSDPFKFGDRIRFVIDKYSGEGIMIGYPSYSKDRKVIVIADDGYPGMPINIKWCKRLNRPNTEKAGRLRNSYETSYPGFLQDL